MSSWIKSVGAIGYILVDVAFATGVFQAVSRTVSYPNEHFPKIKFVGAVTSNRLFA